MKQFNPVCLKVAREYAGLSQSGLSREISKNGGSCTQVAISRFESGDLVPSDDTLSQIDAVLGWGKDFYSLPMEEVSLPATAF